MGIHIGLLQVSLVLAVLCAAAAAPPTSSSSSSSDDHDPGHPGFGVQVLQTLPLKTSRCGAGRFWSAAQGRCAECTHCAGPGREVTIRPCDGHRDAQCGSVTDLHIDWTWLRAGRRNGAQPTSARERVNSLSEAEARLLRAQRPARPTTKPLEHEKLIDFGDDYILPDHPRQPQHHKDKHKHKKSKKAHKSKPFGDYDDFADFGASGDAAVDAVSDDEDLALASWRRAHRHRTSTSRPSTTSPTTTTTTPRPTTTPVSLVEDFIVVKEDKPEEEVLAELEASLNQRVRPDDVATTQTFTTAETLVWDWQAGVLVAAVCACLLFFVVAAAYSCQHAWHFKKLKKNLDADMEEISARLALMSGMGVEHLHDSGSSSGDASEKVPVRRGDHLRTGRPQNDYCLATLPSKTRV